MTTQGSAFQVDGLHPSPVGSSHRSEARVLIGSDGQAGTGSFPPSGVGSANAPGNWSPWPDTGGHAESAPRLGKMCRHARGGAPIIVADWAHPAW